MFKHLAAAALATTALVSPLYAKPSDTDGKIVIGDMADMSGVYSAHSGAGVLAAAEMAVADFGGTVDGRPVSILSADYQLKVDIGMATANR